MSFEFDPTTEQGSEYNLIPKGVYAAEITDADTSVTKAGTGNMLNLTWRITEGEHENRYCWQSVLYVHTNPAAVRIGRAMIKDICTALGINSTITELGVFLYKPALITIGIEQPKDDAYPPKNRVTRVNPRTAQATTPEEKKATAKVYPFNDGVPF